MPLWPHRNLDSVKKFIHVYIHCHIFAESFSQEFWSIFISALVKRKQKCCRENFGLFDSDFSWTMQTTFISSKSSIDALSMVVLAYDILVNVIKFSSMYLLVLFVHTDWQHFFLLKKTIVFFSLVFYRSGQPVTALTAKHNWSSLS